jgi:iron(III)-salmochelin esterase
VRVALSRRAALLGLVGAGCQRKPPPPGEGAAQGGPPPSSSVGTAPSSGDTTASSTASASAAPSGAAAAPSVLDWSFPGASATGGAERAVVVLPARAPNDEARRFPVLVALHGRGEAVRGAEAGAYGWVRDYSLLAHLEALGRGVLRREDFHGFVTSERLAAFNESLRERPYGGLIVVCPHTPDVLQRPWQLESAAPFARWIIDSLVPRVLAECPADASAVGIDGVSLGGRVALLTGLRAPALFRGVGTLQPAFQASEAEALAGRAKAYFGARPEGRVRLLTSEEDPFREAVGAIHEAFRAAGVRHEHRVVVGPHNYDFNRGPGGLEMLAWHDRVLRGFEPI